MTKLYQIFQLSNTGSAEEYVKFIKDFEDVVFKRTNEKEYQARILDTIKYLQKDKTGTVKKRLLSRCVSFG
jgi:hypothetical protein